MLQSANEYEVFFCTNASVMHSANTFFTYATPHSALHLQKNLKQTSLALVVCVG